jgi:tetratricopeptide (TPR) repeat protein
MWSILSRRLHCVVLIAFSVVGFCPCSYPAESAKEDVRLALESYRAHDYKQARLELERSLKDHPDDPASHELLGLVLDMQDEPDEARSHLETALRVAPKNTTYRLNLVTFCLKADLLEDAETALQPLLDSAPNPNVYHALGYIRLKQRQEHEAVSLFQKALELDHDRSDTWYWLGLTYQSLGEYKNALSSYEEILGRDARHFRSHLQTGKIYLALGNSTLAVTHLALATQICPDSSAAHRYLSEAQLAAGQARAAQQSAETSVRLKPQDPRAHYQLGRALRQSGKPADADTQFRIAKEQRLGPPGTPSNTHTACADEDRQNAFGGK